MLESEVLVIYRATVQKGRKMVYSDFLNGLRELSAHLYGQSARHGRGMQLPLTEAFRQTILHHVMPFAMRRQELDVSRELADEGVQAVLGWYRPALRLLFEHFSHTATTADRAHGGISHSSRGEGLLYYTTFMTKFVVDFFARNPGEIPLSKQAAADAFLNSVPVSGTQRSSIGGLDYRQFCECLVRCALTAYQTHFLEMEPVVMIKALFYYMSSAVHVANLQMPGAKSLQQKAKELWLHDGRTSYLQDQEEAKPSGAELFSLAFDEEELENAGGR